MYLALKKNLIQYLVLGRKIFPKYQLKHLINFCPILCISHVKQLLVSKVQIFWEGRNIWKNLLLKIWRYWVASNFKGNVFSNFVAFSEYPNFIQRVRFSMHPNALWHLLSLSGNFVDMTFWLDRSYFPLNVYAQKSEYILNSVFK